MFSETWPGGFFHPGISLICGFHGSRLVELGLWLFPSSCLGLAISLSLVVVHHATLSYFGSLFLLNFSDCSLDHLLEVLLGCHD